MGKRVGLGVWRGCAGEHAHEPVVPKLGCGEQMCQRMSLKRRKEEIWIVGETKGYRVYRNIRNSLAGENVFMLQRRPLVENEIAFLLR